ncbi:MAG: HAD-IA family hydrolase [Acidobacteria bacterium]|nr:HAD-IA family hydrolase [Acidobacteriota bacterium]
MTKADQLLFFDLDDTLVDHRSAEEAAQRELVESFPTVLTVEFELWMSAYRLHNKRLWSAYGRNEITKDELKSHRFRDPLEELGLETSAAEELGRTYLAHYERHWRLNPGAIEILELASKLGTAGILSNGFREAQVKKIERFRLNRYAKHVVLSEDVGVMKPDRRIFDAAAEAASAANGVRKVYVGDSFEHDVLGAKAAGWLPVLYDPRGEAPKLPIIKIKRLADAAPLLEAHH